MIFRLKPPLSSRTGAILAATLFRQVGAKQPGTYKHSHSPKNRASDRLKRVSPSDATQPNRLSALISRKGNAILGGTAQLRAVLGIRIFYDEYEQVKLWGKNLADHFGIIYRRSGHYCVMFISEAYMRKMWTRHERQFAISRAMEERGEYILPARFDSSEVPGIPLTVHGVDLSKKKPATFARFILEKLGKSSLKVKR